MKRKLKKWYIIVVIMGVLSLFGLITYGDLFAYVNVVIMLIISAMAEEKWNTKMR